MHQRIFNFHSLSFGQTPPWSNVLSPKLLENYYHLVVVTVIWCAQRRSISTLGAYHRGSVGSRNFNEERFGNGIVAYFAGHLGRGKGLWSLRKNLACVVGLRFVWFVYSPSRKANAYQKSFGYKFISYHFNKRLLCVFSSSSCHLPTFPSFSFSSFFPLQERAQRFCTVCWDAAFKAAQKTKPSTATTTATPAQGTAVAKAMEVMAEHHAPWIGGWHVSFWGGTGECTDIIYMFVRFWKDQSITMVDPQKNNIHKIINVYLVSIYQLSIFAFLKGSKGMYGEYTL